MKTAKSYKLISLVALFAAVVLFFSLAFGMMNNRSKVSAAANPTDFLTLSEGTTAEFTDDGNLTVTVKDGSTVTFKNKLVISNFAATMSIPANATTTLKMVSDSCFVNGNKVGTGDDVKFEKSIVNEFAIKAGATLSDPISCSLNGGTAENAILNGDFAVLRVSTAQSGNVSVGVKNTSVVGNSNASVVLNNTDEIAKRIKDVNNIAVATVSISFDFADGNTAETATLKIKSINQNFDDPNADKYTQTFALDGDKKLTPAYPRIALNDSFYTRDLSAGSYGVYKAIKVKGEKQTNMTLTPYSVLGGISSSNIYLSGDEDDVLLESGTETPKKLLFKHSGNVSFNVEAKIGDDAFVCEKIDVDVRESNDIDSVAPKYEPIHDDAIDAFKYQLEKEYKDSDGKHVPMGTELEIPSLEDLVYDDVTPYSELSYTVYLKTLTKDTTLSSMEIDLDDVGSYTFFITFTDKAGNAIEKDQFVNEEDDGSVALGVYKDFIFKFDMQDDADISVSASVKNGVGYKGVKYSAAKFNVDANGCTMTYKLKYNADVNATNESDGWKEIPKSSSVSDKAYVSEDGYTYDDVKGFNYDGQLSFVPTKIGAYMIECVATSDVSSRSAEDSMIIKVEKEASVVKVDNKWLQNNVWSVVFLSIGTLCLIGIIVLLCIKPKEEIDD